MERETEVDSTCTFYEQLLAVAAEQGAREEGGEVHKDLPQQGSHLLKSTLQLSGDAGRERERERGIERERE